MQSARVSIIILAGLLVSCAAQPVGQAIAQSKPGDPAIDGASHLLAEADFRALLIVARQKVPTLAPRPYQGIYRVHVISPTKVKVYYGDVADEYVGGWLQLECVNRKWRVTDRSGVAEHVKLTWTPTGLTKRCSQPLTAKEICT